MTRLRLLTLIAMCCAIVWNTPPSQAQGQFSPEVQVGTSIITRYQIDQRTQFLTLLGAPGDVRALAREQLINEAIQLKAAEDAGVTVSPEAIESGITDFASRANLTGDQFLELTRARGISQATVRDFFTAGVAWRETVRGLFGDDVRASVSPDDARRALAQTGTPGGERVLLSEILLPASSPEDARASQVRASSLAGISDETEFSSAARRFSIANSSRNGGALDWVAADGLPPEVRPIIDRLVPGQVSPPVRLESAIGLYLLRDREIVPEGTPETLSVDYALFIASGGPSAASQIAARVDVCDDFYGLAKGLPEDRLVRETKPAPSLPADIRAALSNLDEGETSTALTRNGNATVLMLCQRRPDPMNSVDLEIAGNRLLNTRLGTAASHHLAKLRAEQRIIDFTSN